MFTKPLLSSVIGAALLLTATGCGSDQTADTADLPSIVVTHSVLGSVVASVVGDSANVSVLIPNGLDPHDWEPSAKDIEAINRADLVVANGLSLEGGVTEVLESAVNGGVPVFEATDYVTIRAFAESDMHSDEGADAHSEEGDPHFWTNVADMAVVVEALGDKLFEIGINVGDEAGMTAERLITLDNELRQQAESLTPEQRVLVTGHESMGYFADRYGFTLIGAVIPSVSTQAEVSAGAIAALKEVVVDAGVTVIFNELGTPAKTVAAIASEAGAEVVEISTHVLPEDGSYETFMLDLMRTIVEALKS